MATTSYYTIDGQIIGESTGGTYTGYLPDAPGSVTATVDEAGAVINTYRYKPYGEQLAKTGGSADPKFMWIGQLGYRRADVSENECYVRARHYFRNTGRFIVADPLDTNEGAYNYAYGNPIAIVDPSGYLGIRATDVDGTHKWEASCRGGYKTATEFTDVPQRAGYIVQKVSIDTRFKESCSNPPGRLGCFLFGSKMEVFYEYWCVVKEGSSYVTRSGCDCKTPRRWPPTDYWDSISISTTRSHTFCIAAIGSFMWIDEGKFVGKEHFVDSVKVGSSVSSSSLGLCGSRTWPYSWMYPSQGVQWLLFDSLCCPTGPGGGDKCEVLDLRRKPSMGFIRIDDCTPKPGGQSGAGSD